MATVLRAPFSPPSSRSEIFVAAMISPTGLTTGVGLSCADGSAAGWSVAYETSVARKVRNGGTTTV